MKKEKKKRKQEANKNKFVALSFSFSEMRVKECEVSQQKISNGEFYAFVKGGGYFEQKNWSQEGW